MQLPLTGEKTYPWLVLATSCRAAVGVLVHVSSDKGEGMFKLAGYRVSCISPSKIAPRNETRFEQVMCKPPKWKDFSHALQPTLT